MWLSILPAHDANACLLEALPPDGKLATRIYAGVLAVDPLRSGTQLIRQIKAAGIGGIINYPSVSLIDGEAGATFAELSLGVDREIDFLQTCSAAGLRIAGVAGSLEAAQRLMKAGVDFLAVHAGPPTRDNPQPERDLIKKISRLPGASRLRIVALSAIALPIAAKSRSAPPSVTVVHKSLATVIPKPGRFLLGAAIGTGMAAKAAERGGADFLLALSAGRFRSMGAPSAACMLALRNANRMVMEFGNAEILPNASVPVFFGASSFGIEDPGPLIESIAAAGFHGVVNFPSCMFLDGRYRQFLEESDLGFDREVALLKTARARGLTTLAYVRTLNEARRMAKTGVDIINIEFGWNMGGAVGVSRAPGLQDAAVQASKLITAVHAINKRTRCLIEGGPIVTPEQMDEVCTAAGADGYIGGSTIDRVPLESAIQITTSAFKTIGNLRRQVDSLEQQLKRKAAADALIGLGEGIRRARESVAQAMQSDLPVLIIGEPGTGRREVAQAIHEARVSRARRVVLVEGTINATQDMELNLFGSRSRAGLLERARDSTLLLDDAGLLSKTLQRQLLRAVRNGSFCPGGAGEVVPLAMQFIGITRFDPSLEAGAPQFDSAFARWLGSIRIDLPPLRERLEDLPMLAEKILRVAGRIHPIDPSAYRALLNHDWRGNLRELRAVLQNSMSIARGRTLCERDVASLLAPQRVSGRQTFSSEREWILNGLQRNRFRRAATARYLGIARKTLYNKIMRYGLIVTK